MAKISVILPVYNCANYIKDSIQSILNQSYKDFSLNVIDDGSVDGSLDMLCGIEDQRLKIFRNDKNRGLIYTLNRGLDISKESDYIIRMDADDISLPNRFALQLEVLEKNPEIGVVGSRVITFGDNIPDRLLEVPEFEDKIIPAFICKNPIIHPSVMMRGSILNKSGLGYDPAYPKYEDYKLWIDLFNKCKFYNIPQPLLKYRRHTNNVTNTGNYNLEEDISLFKKILISYSGSLSLHFDDQELDVLATITSTYRWNTNTLIPLDVIYRAINAVIGKHKDRSVDVKYLTSLLWERVIVYLIKSKRKIDLIKLLIKLNMSVDYKKILEIQRKWF